MMSHRTKPGGGPGLLLPGIGGLSGGGVETVDAVELVESSCSLPPTEHVGRLEGGSPGACRRGSRV